MISVSKKEITKSVSQTVIQIQNGQRTGVVWGSVYGFPEG